MDERDWLAERFEEHRERLKAVAYRMLGSPSEADDAIQEAWMRFSRADTSDVENLGSWLTTVVSRVCLNTLQSRRSRPEVALFDEAIEPIVASPGAEPEAEALLGDSLGLALMVVLDKLTPPNGSPLCSTTSSQCRTRRSPRSSTGAPKLLASWPAGPGAGCRGKGRRRPATGGANRSWSTRS